MRDFLVRLGAPSASEELLQGGAGRLGRLFGQEVAAGQGFALDVGGPTAPCLEHRATLVRAATVTPDGEHGAGDLPAGLEIFLVHLAVDVGAGPVVLAAGADHLGVLEAADVFGQGLVAEAALRPCPRASMGPVKYSGSAP